MRARYRLEIEGLLCTTLWERRISMGRKLKSNPFMKLMQCMLAPTAICTYATLILAIAGSSSAAWEAAAALAICLFILALLELGRIGYEYRLYRFPSPPRNEEPPQRGYLSAEDRQEMLIILASEGYFPANHSG
jgi:hypothetical protein